MDKFNEFIESKRRRYEEAAARYENLSMPENWRMKLRVRVVSKFNTDALQIKSRFCGRRIVIRSRKRDEPLNEAEWIIILARRFKTPEAAARFGLDLQTAISAIGALRGFPLDVGFDNAATGAFGEVVKAAVAKEGKWLLDDVHGVDVYPDTDAAVVMSFGAKLSTAFDPGRITGPLETNGKRLGQLDDKGREASLLMNAAFMAPHPVAMVTLSVSAVELLAAGERWSDRQKEWIRGLRKHLIASDGLGEHERAELRQAIDSLNRFGALGRTRRLLHRLGLGELDQRWVDLYNKRSRLFHGDRLVPLPEVQAMGGEARTLGQSIVTAYVERETGVTLD